MKKWSIARSEKAFARAVKLMPGGVSSPVRAFKGVGGTPPYIAEGKGAWITDIDGNEYVDYVASYGPLIAGHANDRVVAALAKAIGKGTTFGAPCEDEIELAEMVTGALPGMEMVRFVNSGTEAAMSAIRLARAATGRDLVVKCIGCYHGHVDALLADAGSGALTIAMADKQAGGGATGGVDSIPSSAGVPAQLVKSTLLVPYNDLAAAERVFGEHGGKIACFAVEPVAGNMGLVNPAPGYLEGLRKLCSQHGTLLLFDEVMTGFRVAWGGAQTRFSVRPDITCLGKVIGGGLPVGAYAAGKHLMSQVAPSGPVYQAGTLSGNPLAMAGGIATLEIMKEPGAYEELERISKVLADGIGAAAARHKVPVAINRCGAMVGLFITQKNGDEVTNFAEATAGDTKKFAVLFHALLKRGVYLAPSMFEALFPGLCHDERALGHTLEAFDAAFGEVGGHEITNYE
jgi:glutamate-1-semialdehyde 2,1-aminomutase